MAYTVFLSHSSTDAAWVKWIANEAGNIGIKVYIYEHDPQPGHRIAEKIKLRIQQCDALVVLLTANSQFSPYVQQEIGFAEASRKLVIPLVQPKVDRKALAMLEGKEVIHFDFNNPKQGLAALLQYLLRLKEKKEGVQAVLALVGLFVAALTLFGKK
jgi:hypothetical protein